MVDACGHAAPSAAVAFVAAAIAVGLSIWRLPRTPAGFASAVAVTFFVFFAFNKQAFCNYYFFGHRSVRRHARRVHPAGGELTINQVRPLHGARGRVRHTRHLAGRHSVHQRRADAHHQCRQGQPCEGASRRRAYSAPLGSSTAPSRPGCTRRSPRRPTTSSSSQRFTVRSWCAPRLARCGGYRDHSGYGHGSRACRCCRPISGSTRAWLWDNPFLIPLGALAMAGYAAYLTTESAPGLRLAVAAMIAMLLVHLMAVALVVPLGLHMVAVRRRALWEASDQPCSD